jgi:hypothetical protein
VHVLATSNGNGYQNWQTRILYANFKLVRSAPGGAARLAGFTRILHRTKPDDLMDEVSRGGSLRQPLLSAWVVRAGGRAVGGAVQAEVVGG